MRLVPLSLVGAVALAAFAGCGVEDEEAGGGGSGLTDPNVAARAQTAVVSGARRLSRTEYDDTLHDLLGDESHSDFANLPEDVNDRVSRRDAARHARRHRLRPRQHRARVSARSGLL